jgi:carbon starvation protein
VGGVHDFTSLVGSIRHRARSVAELAREYMSPFAFRLCLAFIWLALVYVIVVFVDLTSATFADVAYNGGGVALSAGAFIVLALAFGLAFHRLGLRLGAATAVFLPLLLAAVWLGDVFTIPAGAVPELFGSQRNTWNLALVAYALIASVTPVWILLQPRDYLSSFLLYFAVVGGGLGLLLGAAGGGLAAGWPALVTPAMVREAGGLPLGPLFPILFITIACGACSGFHSIVASGTTSKQLRCETDARPVAYGAMLVEGVVAVIALATVMVLPWGGDALRSQPLQVFAGGMGRFLATFGLPESVGAHFGLLALSTFLLTTLDTCTRLGRYVFQEFVGLDGRRAGADGGSALAEWGAANPAAVRWLATAATLGLPTALLFVNLTDAAGQPMPAWRAVWPVFGATNQLLAGLALLVVTIWLRRTGRAYLFAAVPMAFMVAMTMTALWLLIDGYGFTLIGVIAMTLFGLGLLLVLEAARAFRAESGAPEPAVWRVTATADTL